MISRRAPGRIPGRSAARFVTIILVVTAGLAAAAFPVPAARAAVGPIGFGDPTLQTEPQNAASFGVQRLGTRSDRHVFRFRNDSLVPVEMGDVTLEAANDGYQYGDNVETGRLAFSVTTDCPGAVLLTQAGCEVAVTFAPLRPGTSAALLHVVHDGDSGGMVAHLQGDGTVGLYQAGAFGEVVPFGDARTYGDLSHVAIGSPIIGIATTPPGNGYWPMEATGRMHPFGDAPDLGSPALPAKEYAIALAATATGKGYWLTTQVGGVHAV